MYAPYSSMEIFDVFESSQRFNPLFDFLFFKVFGEKGDEKQLIGFLNAVLWRTGGRSTLEIHFINMVKWRKQAERDIVNDPLHRWLVWLDETSPVKMVEEVVNMDNAIMAAKERQDFLLQDDDERRNYWSLRMAEHDRISNLNGARLEGEEIGKKAGKEEAIQEMTKKMLAEGLTLEFVQKITGPLLQEIASPSQ